MQNVEVEILEQKGHRFLWINDYLWMWDIPIEQEIQRQIADEAFGRVLVVGYGLGIIQKYLLDNKHITELITLELHNEVIIACKKVYGSLSGVVVNMDFYSLNGIHKFDCIIGDIWEDILPQQLSVYKKFKSKAEQLLKPNGKILAWGKDFFEYLISKEKA